MDDIVLSCDKLEHFEEEGSNYNFVRSFISDHIHESVEFEKILREQVKRNGAQGLFGITREHVPTYSTRDGCLVSNGISYVVRGDLVSRSLKNSCFSAP